MHLIREMTLSAAAARAVGSTTGSAVNMNLRFQQLEDNTNLAWSFESARLILQITTLTATAAISGMIQGLVPGATSGSAVVSDWYNLIAIDSQTVIGAYPTSIPVDQPWPLEYVRVNLTTANASMTAGVFLVAKYQRW